MNVILITFKLNSTIETDSVEWFHWFLLSTSRIMCRYTTIETHYSATPRNVASLVGGMVFLSDKCFTRYFVTKKTTVKSKALKRNRSAG